jgi:hypothetical protein
MDEQEQERITNWVRMYAQDYLGDVSPALVTDAELSKAVRLRWFDVRISGVLYKVGLNIHYGGAFGALWITNPSDETLEFHPHASPQHRFNGELMRRLRSNLAEHRQGHAYVHKTQSSFV